MKYIRNILAWGSLLLLFSLLAACGSQGTLLSGEEKEAVLAFSEVKTDDLLAGMNANDYAAFSKDFDQDMLKAINEAEFAKLKQDRDAKLGLYISREVNSVLKQGDFYVVLYNAKFEKEDQVVIRVVFREADPHPISGLWFDK